MRILGFLVGDPPWRRRRRVSPSSSDADWFMSVIMEAVVDVDDIPLGEGF
jgi:hypothetical protein